MAKKDKDCALYKHKIEKQNRLETLVSELFDTFDSWEIFNEIEKQVPKIDLEQFQNEVIQDKLLKDKSFFITDLNLLSEQMIRDFCKENEIKILDFNNF